MRVTKQEIDWLNRELLYRGAWLKRYYPGDGVMRYRLVDAREWATRHGGTLADIANGNIPEPDYFGAVAIQTALGSREARIMVESYIAGWNKGRNA